MRKSVAIKTLFRAPVKTLLTLALIAAASFVLFSRVTDYAVIRSETANAESFYHGVAALDITTPAVSYKEDDTLYSFSPDDKPWPAEEKLEAFSSLPGVTVTDTRYMTAGLIEDYKRMVKDGATAYWTGQFVLEGDYAGYEEIPGSGGFIDLLFHNVTVLAGNVTPGPEETVRIKTRKLTENEYEEVKASGFYYGELPMSFFEGVKQGSRCLATGNYDRTSGQDLMLNVMDADEKAFCVLDGLGADYLELPDFAYQNELIRTIRQDAYTFDIVYTSDMRAIPRFNERSMIITQGQPLSAGEENGCVVSELFLSTYHLSVGDKITVKLGNKLIPQNAMSGAMALIPGKRLADFVDTKELEITGAYRMTDDVQTRIAEQEWAYTENTVFVSSHLLPVAVPDDYQPSAGEFSVFVENARDVQAFREAAEPLAAGMGLGLRFSDGGWMRVKDSFATGKRTSFFTAVFYVIGAMIAQLLAVYLYVGGEKRNYAIMRMLGVPVKKAESAVVLPFAVLMAFAIPLSGIAGIWYADKTAAAAFADMSAGMPESFVPRTGQPLAVIAVCLLGEVIYMLGIIFAMLGNMRKIPPFKLLQSGTARRNLLNKKASVYTEENSLLADFEISKLTEADETPPAGKYPAIFHVAAYVFRHIRRNVGRTLLSFLLATVLCAGTGIFILAMHTYREAFFETDVKARATGFSSSSIAALSESGLTDDLYYYGKLSVRAGSAGLRTSMTFTNDVERYLADGYRVAYANGYDSSVFDTDGAVCLLGQTLADALGVRAGDEITFLTDDLYSFLRQMYEDEPAFAEAAVRAGRPYTVAGIIESEDEEINAGIFASANRAAEAFYGQPFPIGYCECILTDNEKLSELNILLDEQKNQQLQYAPTASFYVDTAALENICRIRDFLQSLFPVVVAVTFLLGLTGSCLMIVQSATEAAYMRILGTGRKRARCMLISGHIALSIAAMLLVAVILYLGAPIPFIDSARAFVVCWCLYLVACIGGAFLAAARITGYRILELLQNGE